MVVVVDFAVVVVFLILACQLLLMFKCFLIISNMITAMESFSSHFHTNFILVMFNLILRSGLTTTQRNIIPISLKKLFGVSSPCSKNPLETRPGAAYNVIKS